MVLFPDTLCNSEHRRNGKPFGSRVLAGNFEAARMLRVLRGAAFEGEALQVLPTLRSGF